MRVVIVEDNRNLVKSVVRVLKQEHFLAEAFWNGKEGQEFIFSNHSQIDLVILDVMLPGVSGFEICRGLRAAGISIPVLMLTAKGELEDKVAGFSLGADDYLVKPFDIEELLMRVRALLRRPKVLEREKADLNEEITCDFAAKRVWLNGNEAFLTPSELVILEFLWRNKNVTVSQERIFESCFDFAKEYSSNSIEVHIKNLRKKLFYGKNQDLLKTVRGAGYCLEIQ